jgi:raffinose/stachyose/melibiose transport system permease protein
MKVTKKNLAAVILFLLPGLTLYLFLVLNPIAQSMVFSMFRWVTLGARKFVGFDNFIGVFNNSIFWKSMVNSLYFMVATTVLQVVLGFILGYFVYLQLKFYRVFKTILFMPTILATVAVGFIWGYIYSPGMGLLKPFMELIGLGQHYVPPLSSPTYALIAIILAQTWNSAGIQVILFNSGFMNMPAEVLESASIDGASGFRMIFHMVVPLSWEIIKTVIILQIIGALRSFDLIFVMTGGGPNHATEVLPVHLFVNAFQNFNIGYGSVIAVVIFTLCMVMTMSMRKVMFRENIY